MNPNDPARTDFSVAAKCLAALDGALVVLSLLTHAVARTPWPQLVWLEVFRLPRAGLFAALLTPQPLASPLPVTALSLLFPAAFQLFCLFLLLPVLREPRPLRWFFPVVALLPAFGPVLAAVLLDVQDEYTH